MEITTIPTTAFKDQLPGTSGLRKPVATFSQEHYTENFVQSIFNAIGNQMHGRTLVVGGDGRFLMKKTIATIVKMAAANKVVLIHSNSNLINPLTANRKYILAKNTYVHYVR